MKRKHVFKASDLGFKLINHVIEILILQKISNIKGCVFNCNKCPCLFFLEFWIIRESGLGNYRSQNTPYPNRNLFSLNADK